MISDISSEIGYWIGLTLLVLFSMRATESRPFDFIFFVNLILSQYVLHSAYAFGFGSPIFIFSLLFLIIFLIIVRLPVRYLDSSTRTTKKRLYIDKRWVNFCKWYALVYFLARIAFYPYMAGELLLDERLLAGQENRLLFFLGLATAPALAGILYSWLAAPSTIKIWDYGLVMIALVALLGMGSKAAALPLVLAYIGASSFLGKKIFTNVKIYVLLGSVALLTVYSLTILFPALSLSEIGSLLLYRVAANTDSLEYLYDTKTNPLDFPYSGIGALLPMISKIFGYEFEYSPGVWLHGLRYNDWTGFGPNPGIIMDYYANLHFLGLLASVALGTMVRFARHFSGAVGCSFLAFTYLFVVDVAMFDINLIIWGGFLVILLLHCRWFRFPMPTSRARASGAIPSPAGAI